MINAIFAADHSGGMGFNGTLPWPHNSEDLKRFKDLTTGHVVVMGRRTWDDKKLPKPLPNRTVYVATNKPAYMCNPFKGDLTENLLEIEARHPDKTIWVIGGSGILEETRDLFDRVYLTHIKGSFKVDTRINLKSFLTGFQPVRAEVSSDFQSVFTIYESIFRRIRTSP
jgi:dihydrofolate reductase